MWFTSSGCFRVGHVTSSTWEVEVWRSDFNRSFHLFHITACLTLFWLLYVLLALVASLFGLLIYRKWTILNTLENLKAVTQLLNPIQYFILCQMCWSSRCQLQKQTSMPQCWLDFSRFFGIFPLFSLFSSDFIGWRDEAQSMKCGEWGLWTYLNMWALGSP